MQIVIDIPKYVYDTIVAGDGYIADCDNEKVGMAVKNGTPIPEGHRRKFEEIVIAYPPAELCIYPEYRGKPYFSIKYEENGKHIIGFGTYNPEVFSEYLREYFIAPTIIEEDRVESEEQFIMGHVYVNELDGALPVNFKYHIDYCPPDCGGADCDEYYYSPHCPNCDHNFDNESRTPFCPYCGQKLWWHVIHPTILESEE